MKKIISDNLEMDYNKLKEIGEKSGILDLIKVYESFEENMRLSEAYLREFEPKFRFYVSDSTQVTKEK